MGQGDGGGGGRRTTLPLIDEWGEIVLNDEMIGEQVVTGASEEGETELAQVRHVHEVESRGFHDEDVGRPAFGYEQFDPDFRIGDDDSGGAPHEASMVARISASGRILLLF